MWKLIATVIGVAAVGGAATAIYFNLFAPAPVVTVVTQPDPAGAELLQRWDAKESAAADDRERVKAANNRALENLRRYTGAHAAPKSNPLPY